MGKGLIVVLAQLMVALGAVAADSYVPFKGRDDTYPSAKHLDAEHMNLVCRDALLRSAGASPVDLQIKISAFSVDDDRISCTVTTERRLRPAPGQSQLVFLVDLPTGKATRVKDSDVR